MKLSDLTCKNCGAMRCLCRVLLNASELISIDEKITLCNRKTDEDVIWLAR